ncbi:unnamed protein product, partial [Nesidiocoris tenuis]
MRLAVKKAKKQQFCYFKPSKNAMNNALSRETQGSDSHPFFRSAPAPALGVFQQHILVLK